jgi:hypothetical protein
MKWINTGETTMIIDVDLSIICGGTRRTYKYYFFFVFSSLITCQFSVFLSCCVSLFLLLLSIIYIKKNHAYFSRPSSSQCDANRLAESNEEKWPEKKAKERGKTIEESLSKCTIMLLCGYDSISL